jgi:Fe-S-cluster containining protein
MKLPTIESCDDCGACCFEQQSPPGYVLLLSNPDYLNDESVAEDAARIKAMPEEAVAELRSYMSQLLSTDEPADRVCIWLDRESKQCRYHEFRPSICREFERGSEECRDWRLQYDAT